jgi:hypothetical protein
MKKPKKEPLAIGLIEERFNGQGRFLLIEIPMSLTSEKIREHMNKLTKVFGIKWVTKK